jgi:hypothetical protein
MSQELKRVEAAPTTSNDQITALQRAVRNSDLPVLAKIQAGREFTKAFTAALRTRLDAAVKTNEAQTRADLNTKLNEIQMNADRDMHAMHGAYVELLHSISSKVAIDQLNFVREFGRSLTAFIRQLQADDGILDVFRDRNLAQAYAAFDRLIGNLDELTGRMVASTNNKISAVVSG